VLEREILERAGVTRDTRRRESIHVPVADAHRALIRRAHAVTGPGVEFGRLRLETASKEAFADGRAIALTQREWSILECLVLNAGRIVTRDRLMSAVSDWSDELSPNATEVYVSRLRGTAELRLDAGAGGQGTVVGMTFRVR